MNHLRMVVVAVTTAVLSTVVFLLVVSATALAVLAIVGDDQALVTWSVLLGGAVVGWLAARVTHTWLIRWIHS